MRRLLVGLGAADWEFVLKTVLTAIVGIFYLLPAILPTNFTGHDWVICIRPTIRNYLLKGRSPYQQPLFFNPPWELLFYLPFAFLPQGVDSLVLGYTILTVYGFVAYRSGATALTTVLLLTAPFTINVATNGQADWLVMLGLISPRPIALFLVLIKPQVGMGIALYWLVETWRYGGFRAVLRTFGPVTGASLLSYAIYGPYLLGAVQGDHNLLRDGVTWNLSFWPWSVPIGLLLLRNAIQMRNRNRAILASPFLSPYVAIYSWSVPLAGLLDDEEGMLLCWCSIQLITRLITSL